MISIYEHRPALETSQDVLYVFTAGDFEIFCSEITFRYFSDFHMTYFAERITHSCFDRWSFRKFVNRTPSQRFLIHNSLSRLPFHIWCLQFPSITQQQSLSLSPTPIAIPLLYGPLFPAGSLPNESVSHRLQCSM